MHELEQLGKAKFSRLERKSDMREGDYFDVLIH